MTFETLLLVLLAALAAGGALALVLGLSAGRGGAAPRALEGGDFRGAVAALEADPDAGGRDGLYAAAVAAKHLLDLPRAAALLERLLAEDPRDGEAWLERGSVAAYAGDGDAARRAFSRVEETRADLLETLTLHRAWLALDQGETERARALFEEVEAPLASKLTRDVGGGDPLFAEWFLLAAVLWRARGETEQAAWAWKEGVAAAPESRLPERIGPLG